jgi:NAD(P)-dependent dehydrogenase (short-subunit alcohol dehydrogenase family)
MRVQGQVVVVTGGANGIGRALCEVFHREGAAKIIVADIDETGARDVASSVNGGYFRCDVTSEAEIARLVAEVETSHGPISLFCSNAGVLAGVDPVSGNAGSGPDSIWEMSWKVNVMAHVYAARALIPRMKARGGGYLLNTVSAAGLLSAVGSASYSTTKHAALGFAENVAISHKAHGIKVSALCPQSVDTNLIRGLAAGPQAADGLMSASEVAEIALEGIVQENFLILPHKEVADYVRRKVADYDRWIAGMAKIQAKMRNG